MELAGLRRQAGLLEQALCDAQLAPLAGPAAWQAWPTVGASAVETFTVEGTIFVVLGNARGDEQNYVQRSPVLRYEREAQRFVLHQELDTVGVRDLEHFVIGTDHYLAVAHRYDGERTSLSSPVYWFDPAQRRLVPATSAQTSGAFACEHFVTGGQVYLVFGHSVSEVTGRPATSSPVYRVEGAGDSIKLQFHAPLPTVGVMALRAFERAGQLFVGVANYRDDAGFTLESVIYSVVPGSGGPQFVPVQPLDTAGAYDLEAVAIGADHYLCVANHQNTSDNYDVNSIIYKFDAQAGRYTEWQRVPTRGATDWEVFELGGRVYLALANAYPTPVAATHSRVLHFNATSGRFDVVQVFDDTRMTMAWRLLPLPGTPALAAAVRFDGVDTHNTSSPIYRLNHACP